MTSCALSVLQEHAIEHGADGLLLGLGEPAETLELTLELGRGAPLAGIRAGDAEQHIGGTAKKAASLRHERDGEAEPADIVVRERLLRDADVRGDRLLGEAGFLAQMGEAAAEPAANCRSFEVRKIKSLAIGPARARE